MTTETKSNSPREVFLHLLAIITLYMSAFSFGRLIFNYVNRAFPDQLEGRYHSSVISNEAIRWGIAMLLIVFPVYFFTTRFLQRLYQRDPLQQTRRIRKWLLYLTLFLSAIAILIDLTAVLYKFLGGELTARFALQVLTVLFIAAAIFGYYFWELRCFRESGEANASAARAKMAIRYFVGLIVVIVIAVIVTGFFMVGSPQKERLARFDIQRTNDLQVLQNEVLNFWQQKTQLPLALDELKNDLTGFTVPQDPQTGAAYEYRVAEPLKFELCSTFATLSNHPKSGMAQPIIYPGPYYEGLGNWSHGIGRVCFNRTIDPERFRTEPLLKR